MLSVPKKANDAMHLSMLEGDQHSPLVIDDAALSSIRPKLT